MFNSHSVNSNVCRICQSNNQHFQPLEHDERGYFHSICRSFERRFPRIGERIAHMRAEGSGRLAQVELRGGPSRTTPSLTNSDLQHGLREMIQRVNDSSLSLETQRAVAELLNHYLQSANNEILHSPFSSVNQVAAERARAHEPVLRPDERARQPSRLELMALRNRIQYQRNQEAFTTPIGSTLAAQPALAGTSTESEFVSLFLSKCRENGIQVITTRKGREYQDLVAFLDQKPKDHFVTHFDDSSYSRRALDVAGVTRQLVSKAAEHAFENPKLFSMAGQDRYLHVQGKPDLKGYYELGLILGKVANLDMAVSTCLKDDFFKSMLHGLKLIQTDTWESMGIKSYDKFVVKQSSDQLKKLLIDSDPALYNKPANKDYLDSFDHEELQNKVREVILPYAALAKGFSKTSELEYKTIDTLRGAIGGVVSLKADLKNNYQVNNPYNLKEFDAIEAMIDDALAQFSETELRSLCSTITGASSQLKGKKIDFKVIDDPALSARTNAVFKPSSCDKTMQVNVHTLKRIVKEMYNLPSLGSVDFRSPEVKELFRTMLLGEKGDALNAF